jgi:hypothetical protein
MPKTSAKASFVLMVTVGSPFIMLLRVGRIERVDPWPSSFNRTDRTDVEEEEDRRELDAGTADLGNVTGSGGHFFPSNPIDLARASWMLCSPVSAVNSSGSLKRNSSGFFPGPVGANITLYRDCAVEVKVVEGPMVDEGLPSPLGRFFGRAVT